jgi:isopropylmalate/homocitrate/citramalate synthase
LGIYNSAIFVSANNGLRKFIHKHALKLLNPIGQAELQIEIQKTVKKISDRKGIASITTETSIELDEEELKKYLDNVIKEVKKRD